MFNGIHTMGAGGLVLMALLWIAFVAAIVWIAMRLFPTRTQDRGRVGGEPVKPREILDRRLADGEIDVKTYEDLRAKLDPRSLAGRG
jgi:uncharacterized membrane protein